MTATTYDVLQPLEETLTISGELVTVKTFKAGQVSFVLPRIRKLFDAMYGTASSAESESEINWLKTAVVGMFNHLELIFGSEETFELMAISINRPVDFVKEASIDEARELFDAMFKVNFTYFFKLALPQTMEKALSGLANLEHAEKVEVLKKLMK